jgi:hypothetical protein
VTTAAREVTATEMLTKRTAREINAETGTVNHDEIKRTVDRRSAATVSETKTASARETANVGAIVNGRPIKHAVTKTRPVGASVSLRGIASGLLRRHARSRAHLRSRDRA